MDIILVIDDNFVAANKKFKLTLTEPEMEFEAWTIDRDETQEIFCLFKSDKLSFDNMLHELMHVIMAICKLKGIKPDCKNDEPLAYLQGYVGNEILKFREEYLKK